MKQSIRLKNHSIWSILLALAASIIIGCGDSDDSGDSVSPEVVIPGFSISSISGDTSEDGTTAEFTMQLTSTPNGNVAIDIVSSDETEGIASPEELTFTTTNWDIAQTVTVTGVDDTTSDGDQTYSIQLSINSEFTTDTTGYADLNPGAVNVTNADDDSDSGGGDPSSDAEPLPKVSLSGVSATDVEIILTWTDPTEAHFDHVEITMDGSETDLIQAGIETFTKSGLSSSTTYSFTIRNADDSGGFSDPITTKVKTNSTSASMTYLLIETVEDLNAVRGGVSGYSADWSLDASYIVVADLDLSGYASGEGWEPLGDNSTPYNGVFLGSEHTISNLTIDRVGDYQGLFGALGSNAEIKNLELVNVSVSGKNYVGGLAGRNDQGSITDSYTTGEVSSTHSYVGGIIGRNQGGTLSDSYSTADVSNDSASGAYSGGLTGSNSGTISDCHASGDVSGIYATGGLSGENYGTITNSHATGSVSGGQVKGGLIGSMLDGTVSNCYATGSVNSTGGRVGGLVGSVGQLGTPGTATIVDSHATGAVSGGHNGVGGLVGALYSGCSISNSYATGSVSSSRYNTGGLVGENDGNISLCYANGDVSGVQMVGGLVGSNGNSVVATIEKSYATGSVTGTTGQTGGLVGIQNNGSISNSYAVGSVNGNGNQDGGLVGYIYAVGTVSKCYATGLVDSGSSVGGLIGVNADGGETNISDSFWDTETTGQSSSDGGTGKITSEMENVATFTDVTNSTGLDNAWDFVGQLNDDSASDDIWSISDSINSGYPYLTDLEP